MHFRKTLILATILCLLSSCAATAGVDISNANTSSTSGVKFSPIAHARTIELLDFIAIFPDISSEEQKTVYKEVSQALANEDNNLKLRIQKAAILALPNSEIRDTTAAQTQLQALLASSELTASDTSLVKLLLTYTLDHQKQISKVRDEAKKSEALKLKNKALVQKLNDLKNIEKTMIERNVNTNNNP